MSAQDPSTKITLQVDKRTHHDLRTPLNQIIGYSEMLAEEANSINQGNLIPDLQKINQAAHKMLQLVDDLFFTENADSPSLLLLRSMKEPWLSPKNQIAPNQSLLEIF